jgi:hypothetical protein
MEGEMLVSEFLLGGFFKIKLIDHWEDILDLRVVLRGRRMGEIFFVNFFLGDEILMTFWSEFWSGFSMRFFLMRLSLRWDLKVSEGNEWRFFSSEIFWVAFVE